VDIWTFFEEGAASPFVTVFGAHRRGLAAVHYAASTGSFAVGPLGPFHIAAAIDRIAAHRSFLPIHRSGEVPAHTPVRRRSIAQWPLFGSSTVVGPQGEHAAEPEQHRRIAAA